MALLFISSIVPDKEKFQSKAFNRSGNNVLLGIADALPSSLNCEVWGAQPVPSFPQGKMWISGGEEQLNNGKTVYLIPFLNIKLLKDIFKGFYCLFRITKWKRKHKDEECKILLYNIYSPPIPMLSMICRLFHIQLFAILYDLGVPPKRLGLSWATMLGYRIGEYFAKKYIPQLDGRIVINESIVRYYAPQKDYLLIDGGINDNIVKHLFPLKISETIECIFVCAGMLWDQNGTKLILEAMKLCANPNIKVVFAGRGIDVELIKKASLEDNRISYVGMLSIEDLFKLYEKADVLLNLRIEEDVDFHFPSKLLEYMATGKLVLSTPIAHAKRDYGHLIEILKDTTPQALRDAMMRIAEMPKSFLYEKGLRAREFMLENRTWKKRTDEIINYMYKDGQDKK